MNRKEKIIFIITVILLVILFNPFFPSVKSFLLLVIIFGFPYMITLINFFRLIKNLFFKNNISLKLKKILSFINLITIILGIVLNVLFNLVYSMPDYDIKVIEHDFYGYTPIHSSHLLTILVFFILGYISFIIIDKKRLKLPPLSFVINLSFLLIGNIVMAIYLYQISNNVFDSFNSKNLSFIEKFLDDKIYLILFPINFLMISFILLREIIAEYTLNENNKKIYKYKILNFLNNVVINSQNWILLAFIFAIPILLLIIAILTLFGQQPDSLIKAFTETSDWKLSQHHVQPPRIEYTGHYLCTVSLRGHKKIVKPKRYGIRGGEKIIVNRQLMIANAFEQVIQEKMPLFHKIIRNFYDKYGFPLSKLIKTKLMADIIYLLMKPFEYIFLIFLYLVDINPENRIETQYLPFKIYKKNRKE